MQNISVAFLLAVSALFSSVATAGQIEDPQGLLKTLATTRSASEFTDSFQMNDEITLRIFNKDCIWGCGPDGCGLVVQKMNPVSQKKLEKDGPAKATAVCTDGNSDVFARSEYESFGKSTLLKALSELDVFLGMSGKVLLTSLTPMDFVLANTSKIPAFQLRAEFVTAENSMEIEFIVAKDKKMVPGIAEILFLRIGGYQGQGGEKLFKVKALSRGAN